MLEVHSGSGTGIVIPGFQTLVSLLNCVILGRLFSLLNFCFFLSKKERIIVPFSGLFQIMCTCSMVSGT